jgi:hypothetical protein
LCSKRNYTIAIGVVQPVPWTTPPFVTPMTASLDPLDSGLMEAQAKFLEIVKEQVKKMQVNAWAA